MKSERGWNLLDITQFKARLIRAKSDPFARKTLAGKFLQAGWYFLRMLLVFGLCFVLLYPLLYMLSMTFRPVAESYDPAVIWVPKHFTLDNIREAIRYMNYGESILNSVLIHIVSSLFQVAVCAVTGYGFARFAFRGKKILFSMVLFTLLLPPQVTIIPLSRVFSSFDFMGLGKLTGLFGAGFELNLLDTPLTVYLPALFGAGIKSGLFIFIFRQFFRGLPKELEDAAAIDGCGFFQTFLKIILPNAAAVCLTAVILSIVWYWNDYFYSSLFVPNFPTVSLSLSNLSGAYAAEHVMRDPFDTITLMQAGALLTVTPILVMYLILQRFFVQGVERSGLVG